MTEPILELMHTFRDIENDLEMKRQEYQKRHGTFDKK
jgi:hypothetical protein